ncbi:MAG TPA: hypothetical protein VJ840_08450 [Gemmatimonadaceae bacterium]|nr:hypothetical protein [Gemmatimonadaceae bacterium]
MKSLWIVASIGVALSLACRRESSQQSNADDLVAQLAQDTTIIEQSDRSPDTDALSRLLERIGIPFDQRLARSERDCLVTGKHALSSPTVSCGIREGAEPAKLHIVADSTGFNELQVLNGAQVVQHIDLAEFERPDSAAAALYAEDLDGDGAREVIMQRFAGATGNTGFTVWRADPVAHHLTPDSAMTAMAGLIRMPGRPCVLQSWNTSAYDHVSMIECYLDKQWKKVWVTSTEAIRASNRIARQLEVLVRDTLRLIRADTVTSPD